MFALDTIADNPDIFVAPNVTVYIAPLTRLTPVLTECVPAVLSEGAKLYTCGEPASAVPPVHVNVMLPLETVSLSVYPICAVLTKLSDIGEVYTKSVVVYSTVTVVSLFSVKVQLPVPPHPALDHLLNKVLESGSAVSVNTVPSRYAFVH